MHFFSNLLIVFLSTFATGDNNFVPGQSLDSQFIETRACLAGLKVHFPLLAYELTAMNITYDSITQRTPNGYKIYTPDNRLITVTSNGGCSTERASEKGFNFLVTKAIEKLKEKYSKISNERDRLLSDEKKTLDMCSRAQWPILSVAAQAILSPDSIKPPEVIR